MGNLSDILKLFLVRWKYWERSPASQVYSVFYIPTGGWTSWPKFPDGTCWPLNCKNCVSLKTNVYEEINMSSVCSSFLYLCARNNEYISFLRKIDVWLFGIASLLTGYKKDFKYLHLQVLTSYPFSDAQYCQMLTSYGPQATVFFTFSVFVKDVIHYTESHYIRF